MKCIKSNWIYLRTGHVQSGSCSLGTQTLPPRVCGYGPAAAVYIPCGLFVFSHCDLSDATSPEGREAILRNDEVDRFILCCVSPTIPQQVSDSANPHYVSDPLPQAMWDHHSTGQL